VVNKKPLGCETHIHLSVIMFASTNHMIDQCTDVNNLFSQVQ